MPRPARRVSPLSLLNALAGGGLLAAAALAQQTLDPSAPRLVLRQALLIGRVGQYGRTPVHVDALEAQLVAGRWSTPRPGQTLTLPDGSTRTWQAASAAADGWFQHDALRGGYACLSVRSAVQRVMILDATGHSMVYVNGQPRAGDGYQTGKVRLPLRLRAGANDLLFACRRGRLRAELRAPRAAAMLDTADATLPDLIVGEPVATWAAVVVLNASGQALSDLLIEAADQAGLTTTPLPTIPPLSLRKVGFELKGPAPLLPGPRRLELTLRRKHSAAAKKLDQAELTLEVRNSWQTHKRTFISAIDGSVQYYAVTPARPDTPDPGPLALFLTLHGAGVEAAGQARCYAPKSWGHVVAPTNRRPFGFDWEDWGRLDALEVLELAQRRLGSDPRRTYLTGHSMGGHGVWHLAATFPDRFAAIGPSAGWISFWSYAGAVRYQNPTPLEQILIRANAPSDTLSLARNYLHCGVYILHGQQDDNVPVAQARTMRQRLAEFHPDFAYHEQPGAGHWWDAGPEPGTACVDWPPLFQFFRRHTAPDPHAVRRVQFATASPAVSASCHWVTIEAQVHQLQPSRVDISFRPPARRFVGTSDNVARLSLDLRGVEPGDPLTLELDGQTITGAVSPAGTRRLWLARDRHGKWSNVGPPAPQLKGPQRYGPFKRAFRNRAILVYGTSGSPEENAWSFAKARYDAETFWYRGNGSLDVVPDTAFDPARQPERNVVLYGRPDTNAAWQALLADSPVQVRRGSLQIGQRELRGPELGCLFIRPRPRSRHALVGVVSGTGLPGLRLTERLPYFVSGIAYPDCFVLSTKALHAGVAGVRAAGFFGLDWSVTSGEFAWR